MLTCAEATHRGGAHPSAHPRVRRVHRRGFRQGTGLATRAAWPGRSENSRPRTRLSVPPLARRRSGARQEARLGRWPVKGHNSILVVLPALDARGVELKTRVGPLPARCPLCSRPGPLTDEDLVPTWARRYLIQSFGPFPGGKAPRRVKMRICATCNGRLGRRFEAPAAHLLKPMVGGEPITLSTQEQSRVGSWAIKTSLMLAFSGLTQSSWGYELARHLINQTIAEGHPPKYASVRLGHQSITTSPPNDPPKLPELVPVRQMPRSAFFGVCTVGHLAWIMVVGGTEDILQYASWCETDERYLQRVWPPRREAVAWPPPGSLNEEVMSDIRKAFVKSRPPRANYSEPMHRVWEGPEDP